MLMLLFYIGHDRYALDCEPIVEIFPKVNLKTIPDMPPYMAGLMNYGGNPIPVIDTVFLVEEHPSGNAMHTRIVLTKHSSSETPGFLGLICEKAISTIDVDLNHFISTGIKFKEKPFLGGIYTEGPVSIQYFDVKLLKEFLAEKPLYEK